VPDIPAEKLTHLIYAFANISGEGECVPGDPQADLGAASLAAAAGRPPGGNVAALAELRREHPHLNILISIGGYTWSGGFSDAALTPDTRRRFAESCVALMARYGFDGLDVDWEFPVEAGLERTGRPEDRENYTRLLNELRGQLDVQGRTDGRDYLLTVAAPHIPRFIAHMDLPAIAPLVDWFNLMSYSFPGERGKTTHQAPLYAAGEGEPYAQKTTRLATPSAARRRVPGRHSAR
jgi:chitinase